MKAQGGPPLEGDIGSLTDQIRASDGYRYQMRIQVLSSNYYIFERNFQEFIKLLEEVENPDSFPKVWSPDKAPVLQQVMREVARLLQNLVASAKSLVDHTRNLVREWYECSDFMELYQAEIDLRFAQNPTAQFVEDLRDYCLHYRLPPISATLSIDQVSPHGKQTIQLDKSELLQWKRWPKVSLQFLGSASERIELESVCLQYYAGVRDFHRWMRKQLVTRHRADLEWLGTAVAKYREMEVAIEQQYSAPP